MGSVSDLKGNPFERRVKSGRALRKITPRSSHGAIGDVERDPVSLLEANSAGRLDRLVPLRYGRMLASPFTFYRGGAAVQANDLATTPSSSLVQQICGDAHLMNFGGFASPERTLIFDLNDFDETHPGPWEWDVKRLAASVTVAGRHFGYSQGACDEIVYNMVEQYRQKMSEFAQCGALELWYDRLSFDNLLRLTKSSRAKRVIAQVMAKASQRTHESLLPKLARHNGGNWTMNDAPPGLIHFRHDDVMVNAEDDWLTSGEWRAHLKPSLDEYRSTLNTSHQDLLDKFELQDFALKVVGVGSVGTRCGVLLYVDAQGQPLFLQFKQASRSVLAPFVPSGGARYEHEGQRVVAGQRLMQSSSDIFLGWAKGPKGTHYYVRQLRDMKVSFELELLDQFLFGRYAFICGDILARAHARAGGLAPEIGGYLGKNSEFADALVVYANDYADQVERDYDAFRLACRNGRLTARTDADYAGDFTL
jgi:uncharacterized protein (DUF2252 family)